MSEKDVFVLVVEHYYSLTSSEKKIADYVLIHQANIQYLSISELAEKCNVAEATISRFCKRLHFERFSAFKLAVAASTSTHDEHNLLTGEISPDDSIPDLCQKIYSSSVNALEQGLSLLHPEVISSAADALADAKQVLCIGQGGSMILAHEAAHLFSTAFTKFFAVWDSHLQTMAITQLQKGDAVIFFSYTGSTKDLMESLALVKSRGATSILITHFPKSPGALIADIVLQCSAKEGPYQSGSMTACMTQLFIVDILYNELVRRNMEPCKARREAIAAALAEKHL